MSLFRSIKIILTLTCDEATRLLSDSSDRRLTFSERLAVRLHALICRQCRRFRRQLRFLADVFRRRREDLSEPKTPSETRLPDTARGRIQQALDEAGTPPGQ
jgi:hypothetical protein